MEETKSKLMSIDEQILNKLCESLDESLDDDPPYALNDPNIHADDLPNNITQQYAPVEPSSTMPEADEWDAEVFNQYISVELLLSKDGEYVLGKVIGHRYDRDGNPIGQTNNNPILDTRVYDVIFPDGNTLEYSANVIAECIYSQVDNKGNQFLLLDDVIDWKRSADTMEDNDILQISHNGNLHKWRLCVLWKDGSTS
jgi:hypothetical protein